MANLTVTSQICIRIVLAFLQFLSTVQPGDNDEKDAIKRVAKSLKDIFKIKPEMVEDDKKIKRPGILETFFSTPQDDTQDFEDNDDDDDEQPCSSTAPPAARKRTPSFKVGGSKKAGGRNMVSFQNEFKQAVMKNGSLESLLPHNTPKRRINTLISKIFYDALASISQEGTFRYSMKEFAHALKEMGNKAMASKSYMKAAQFYSCSISLSVDNAIYYCNRAKALLKIEMFHEATADCCKAILLNSTYVKAYCRLGLAYSAQNKYFDAICEGFLKALQLDPKNKKALTQIEVAESKLSDQLSGLDDQLEELRKKGKIKRCSKVGIKEGSALIYQGKGEDGKDEFLFVEEEKFDPAEIEETMSIQEFIQLFSQGNIS